MQMYIILAVFAALLFYIIWFEKQKEKNPEKTGILAKAGSVIARLLLFIGSVLALLTAVFIAAMMLKRYYWYALLPMLIVFVLMMIVLFLPKSRLRSVLLKVSAVITAFCVLACVGVKFWYQHLDNITVVDNTNIDTTKYRAFDENADLVRLDHEASLRFTLQDNLPVVDGAAALFPMYSSFVNAVYPQNIGSLNTPGSPYRYYNTVSGFVDLILKEGADIMFMAEPSESQMQEAEAEGVELDLVPIGREGFVFFVNEKNPVSGLTQDQLRKIYSGEITNWKEVGGEDSEIIAFQRNANSGSQSGMVRFMNGTELMDAPSDTVVDAMSGIIERVSDYKNFKGAIGFSYYIYASQIKENKNLKLIAVDGVEPMTKTIGDGTYPITDNFYMVMKADGVTDEMRQLIDWVLSEEGQYIVEQCGYAPVK